MIVENKNFYWMKLVVSVVFCVFLGWIGGLFTQHSIATWYPKLIKASWTPPNSIFPIAWTLIYIMIGVSFWLIWTHPSKNKGLAYTLFGIQLFLNFIWSFLFFYLESPLLGVIDIFLLLIAIILNILAFLPFSVRAACLLVPYFLWVIYATSLNLFIWRYN